MPITEAPAEAREAEDRSRGHLHSRGYRDYQWAPVRKDDKKRIRGPQKVAVHSRLR